MTAAERRSGTTTPAAPANSAERQTAPRLRGSWTWSRATSSASSPPQQPARVGVRIGIDLGDDALVVGRPAEPLQLLRDVSGARQTRCTRRLPRSASATGWRRR